MNNGGTNINSRDPLLFIRDTNPVDPAELEEFAASPVGTALHDRILASDPSKSAAAGLPLRRHRALRISVAMAVAAVAVAAAAVVLPGRPTTNPLTVGCYQAASQEADSAVIAFDPDREDLGPVGTCAIAWPSAFGQPAPEHLVACVVTGGGLGVFPTEPGDSPSDACNAIGAAPAIDGDYSGITGADVRWLNAQLRAHHNELQGSEGGCVGADHLATEFEAILDQAGIDQWRMIDGTVESDMWTTAEGTPLPVTASIAPDGSVCADFVLEATQGQILLITDWPSLPDS